MPPKKAKQTASNRSSADAPAPKVAEPPAQTPPQNGPQTAAVGITQAQKQALIDNLQLEVTERARKLRAQYAEHALSLRSRLEMRVNRIPQGLRKRKMGDLLDEFAQKDRPADPPAPQAISVQRGPEEEQAGKVKRGVKRASDQISTSGTEEPASANADPAAATQPDLANPKKRVKTTTTKTTTTAVQQANTKAARSKNAPAAAASTVLSPKSHNSRTLPRSPFKAGGSPEKPSIQLVRPTSPAKPAVPAKAGARVASRQQTTKKAAPGPSSETDARSSGVSDSSAGTTIVKKPAAKGRAAPAKKLPTATKAGAGAAAKKTTAAAAVRKENVAPTPVAVGGRSLRSKRA